MIRRLDYRNSTPSRKLHKREGVTGIGEGRCHRICLQTAEKRRGTGPFEDWASHWHGTFYAYGVTAETFRPEIDEAMRSYDKYVICIDKTPEEFQASLQSLLAKAIKAYENRDPSLRHGIALDRQITVILSQNDTERPLCGIYFNLHSPYQKQAGLKPIQIKTQSIGEG